MDEPWQIRFTPTGFAAGVFSWALCFQQSVLRLSLESFNDLKNSLSFADRVPDAAHERTRQFANAVRVQVFPNVPDPAEVRTVKPQRVREL